jgi:hypothetical protein
MDQSPKTSRSDAGDAKVVGYGQGEDVGPYEERSKRFSLRKAHHPRKAFSVQPSPTNSLSSILTFDDLTPDASLGSIRSRSSVLPTTNPGTQDHNNSQPPFKGDCLLSSLKATGTTISPSQFWRIVRFVRCSSGCLYCILWLAPPPAATPQPTAFATVLVGPPRQGTTHVVQLARSNCWGKK